MKKIILNTMLGLFFISQLNLKGVPYSSFSNKGRTLGIKKTFYFKDIKENYSLFPINSTFEATNGCIFIVKGEYTFLGGFVGTISIACPGETKKIYTFEFIIPSGGGTIVYVAGDAGAWNQYIANDTQLKSDIATYLTGL